MTTNLAPAEAPKREVLSIYKYQPYIEKRFALRTPIYSETASYGHMGRESRVVTKTFDNAGWQARLTVKLFPWEELNAVEAVRKAFKLA